MLLLVDLSMALLLPLNALPPAAIGARCAAAAPRRLGRAVAMGDAAREAACEAAPPACYYSRRSLLLGATLRHPHRSHPIILTERSLQPLAVLSEGRVALAHVRGEACVVRRQGTEVRRCR